MAKLYRGKQANYYPSGQILYYPFRGSWSKGSVHKKWEEQRTAAWGSKCSNFKRFLLLDENISRTWLQNDSRFLMHHIRNLTPSQLPFPWDQPFSQRVSLQSFPPIPLLSPLPPRDHWFQDPAHLFDIGMSCCSGRWVWQQQNCSEQNCSGVCLPGNFNPGRLKSKRARQPALVPSTCFFFVTDFPE